MMNFFGLVIDHLWVNYAFKCGLPKFESGSLLINVEKSMQIQSEAC